MLIIILVKIIHLRASAYALLAVGLINLTYQNHKDGILLRSLLLIFPGLIGTLVFANKNFQKLADNKKFAISWLILSAALILIALLPLKSL